MLTTACSFDVGSLRAPEVEVRDGASDQPDAPYAADAGDDARAGLPDLAREVRPESQAAVSDPDARADGQDPGDVPLPEDVPLPGDVPFPGDLPGEATVSGVGDGADEAPSTDAGGADGGGTGGGMGGTGGSGTGGVTTGGSYGGEIDGSLTDAPDTGDTLPDSGDEVGVASVDPDLVLWYRFDESSGMTAYDSAKFAGVARDATLATVGVSSTAGFSAAKQVGTHAVALAPGDASSGGGFVVMPTLHDLAPDAITISLWLNLGAATSNQNWERVFDYADSTTNPNWFNLTARTGSSPYGPLFAMANVGRKTADQQLLASSTVLTANVWHHVAIVLPAGETYTGLMYIDGAVVATNKAMTLHLSDIGATVNNWLGRSEFAADPYFNGSMDDFRVYKRALGAQEIAALMSLR